MSYKVETIAPFRKEAKRLIKKYPSLRNEIIELGNQLSVDPFIGTPLGNKCYKIRIGITSKRKGKSGGARVITHFYLFEGIVFLLYIFDKSDIEGISDQQIKALLSHIRK